MAPMTGITTSHHAGASAASTALQYWRMFRTSHKTVTVTHRRTVHDGITQETRSYTFGAVLTDLQIYCTVQTINPSILYTNYRCRRRHVTLIVTTNCCSLQARTTAIVIYLLWSLLMPR